MLGRNVITHFRGTRSARRQAMTIANGALRRSSSHRHFALRLVKRPHAMLAVMRSRIHSSGGEKRHRNRYSASAIIANRQTHRGLPIIVGPLYDSVLA